jgi:hypothetical protein
LNHKNREANKAGHGDRKRDDDGLAHYADRFLRVRAAFLADAERAAADR